MEVRLAQMLVLAQFMTTLGSRPMAIQPQELRKLVSCKISNLFLVHEHIHNHMITKMVFYYLKNTDERTGVSAGVRKLI